MLFGSMSSWLVWLVMSVVGGTAPTDTYEVALLNGCDLQDASQFIQVSHQQQQQLAVLYNNILPISEYIQQLILDLRPCFKLHQ